MRKFKKTLINLNVIRQLKRMQLMRTRFGITCKAVWRNQRTTTFHLDICFPEADDNIFRTESSQTQVSLFLGNVINTVCDLTIFWSQKLFLKGMSFKFFVIETFKGFLYPNYDII